MSCHLEWSIWELKRAEGLPGAPAAWEDRTAPLDRLPPACPHCGGLARPNVVWFGESIDPAVLRCCQRALDCDVFLSVGTSSVVYPAAGLVFEAKRRGACTVEINPMATDASAAVDLAIVQPAEGGVARSRRTGLRSPVKDSDARQRDFQLLQVLALLVGVRDLARSSLWKNSTCAMPSLA